MAASRFGTGGKRYKFFRTRQGFGVTPAHVLTQDEILTALGLTLTGNAGKTLKVKADETGFELVV